MENKEWRKIIYDDYGRATPKSGIFVREDTDFVYLMTNEEKNIIEAIQKKKIVRMEIRMDETSSKEGERDV